MPSDVHEPTQSPFWSYIRRRSSVALPKRENSDPNLRKQLSMKDKVTAAWMNQGQRARYIKTGCVIAFVLLIIYYIAPGSASTSSTVPYTGGSSTAPSTSNGDPALSTTKCTRSYSKTKPLVQYALMIDAGSTGSRIHVYRFNNCGPTPELEDEIFEMTAKKEGGSGLSSYKGDAEGAAKSLDMLMDVAVKNVPDKLKSCTPVAVKATAGLRKLGPEMSDAILKAVRERLETVYPFPVVSAAQGGVEVMDGKDEGVYAWITTNYLLGKIGSPEKKSTAAVFDLGGGSTQIVFQPTFKEVTQHMQPGDHAYALDFGGREFELYQHSYLGYGLMEARNNLHRLVLEAHMKDHVESGSTAWLDSPIPNPCLLPDTSRALTVQLTETHPLGKSVKVNMTGPSNGSPAQCRALAERTLQKDAECKVAPCAFAGVHQPPMSQTFSHESEEIYLFSYFYDRLQPLGMPSAFTLHDLADVTAQVCNGGSGGAWSSFSAFPEALSELEGRPETCLDLSFMLVLLREGYGLPADREVRIAKKIAGRELGWCLGASLPLLDTEKGGWGCKIRQTQ